MRFWVVQMGELLAGVDGDTRDYRYMLLAKQLAANEHSVLRWSTTFDHIKKRFRFDRSTTVEVAPQLTLRLLHALPAYGRNISLARFLQQRHAARLFTEEAHHLPQPDLIYAGVPVPELAEACLRCGRRHGIPVVVDVQDLWPDIYLSAFPCAARWIGRLLLAPEFARSRRIFRQATAITAVSQTYFRWATDRAGRAPGEYDGVYPLGFTPPTEHILKGDDERTAFLKRWGIQAGDWVASFLGTFGNSYDIETIVQAARLLQAQRDRRIHIVMAGDGEKMGVARSLAEGVATITLPGWIDQSSALALSALSSVGLCAYAKHAYQSIPYKPLEYMAAGLPLISSLPGEMREILASEQCGLYYEAGNAESLCARLLELAAQPERCAEMGRRSRALFERRFNARVIYPQLAGQLEHLALESRKQHEHDRA